MKRLLCMAAALFLAAAILFAQPVGAISAEKWILVDGTTGRVLSENNADSKSLIASTTKIMTALIVCEQCNVLDRMRIPKEAVGIEGSSMYLKEGEVLTVQDLLYGLMLSSGNDAAVALAIYCGGTVEGFAGLMNDKAHALGMKDSHFVNPNGLDAPGHYSTARDLAILSAYAMANPIFRQTVSTKTVRVGDRTLQNHNKLLWRVEGADGVKTGYTQAAGRILVSSATRQGRRLIAVTINDRNDWEDHEALYSQGFSNFSIQQIISQGDVLGWVEVAGSSGEKTALVADEDFSYALAEGVNPEVVITGPGFVYAPVEKEADAGLARITLGGKCIGSVRLVFGDTVAQEKASAKRSFWQRITEK